MGLSNYENTVGFATPEEYKAGLPRKNSIAPGGFQDHFVIKRFAPINGNEFKLGSRVQFKIADDECLLHSDQVYLKWKPTATIATGAPYAGTPTTTARAALSGKTAAIRSASATCYGEVLETIPNYNRYWAQEIINAPLEQKVYLRKTEGISYFTDGNLYSPNAGNPNTIETLLYTAGTTPDAIKASINGQRYYMHQLQLSALSSLGALELPLIRGGINVELVLETDINTLYPIPDGITNEVWNNVELVCVMTRPRDNFWETRTKDLERGGVIQRPIQTLRWQTFQGNNGSQFTMNVDSNIVRSISSVMVLGSRDASPANGVADKLSSSHDNGIRSIRFTANGKVIPEMKGISYSTKDPEAYVLGFRHQDLQNISFVPSQNLYDSELSHGTGTSAVNVRGWQFRFSFKDSLSSYGDGLTPLSGNFGITVSTVPEAPDFVGGTSGKFNIADSFDVYYVVDQVLEITKDRVRITPVF